MIEKHYGDKYQVIYEPLDLWIDFKDKKGKNILEYFYEDPKRYSYTFQNIAFISRVENLKKIYQNESEKGQRTSCSII